MRLDLKHNMHSALNVKLSPKRYTSYLCKNHVVKIKVLQEAHCSVHLVCADGTR